MVVEVVVAEDVKKLALGATGRQISGQTKEELTPQS